MGSHRKKVNEKKSTSSLNKKEYIARTKLNESKISNKQFQDDTLFRIFVVSLAAVVGILNIYHVSALFENSLRFSHLSDLEREMVFRSEMGMYYSYYKNLITAPSFYNGIIEITNDVHTEYPTTINALERFNLLPELVIGGMYRLFISITDKFGIVTKQCWQVNRGSSLPPVSSCEGLGDPMYFYLNAVWACAGLTASLIFIFSVFLSGSISGGILGILSFFANHGECTRVMWTPPLRESFGYPFCLFQILIITFCLENNKHTDENVSLSYIRKIQIFLVSISTWTCLMLWQFSQFVFITQTLAVITMFSLSIISRSSAAVVFIGQGLGIMHTLVTMFGNELLSSSLFMSLVISSLTAVLFLTPNLRKTLRFFTCFFVLMGFTLSFAFILKFQIFTTKHDSHIISILLSKFTNYKDFHTLLYTCAPEFDFLGWETAEKLLKSGLIPMFIIVVVILLAEWKDQINIKLDRPLNNLNPKFVYTFLQLSAFAIMAVLIMRLKLFFTPHMCIFGSLIGCHKLFKNKISNYQYFGLYGVVISIIIMNGFHNLSIQRNIYGEYSNVPLEELINWINSQTSPKAVFASTMPITATILLTTKRPIVNHPHYEDENIRFTTKKVYWMFSRGSSEELFLMLSDLKVEYLVVPHQWCLGKSRDGCGMTDIWDIEQPYNVDKPKLCLQLIAGVAKPFHRLFSNEEYTVLHLPSSPYVELKDINLKITPTINQ